MGDEEKKQEKEEAVIDWKLKADEYLDGWKRARADYINREKTILQEKSALRELVQEASILEFLPVLDNLKQALSTSGFTTPDSNWVKGIQHVVKQFEDILNNFGIQRVDILDKDFDPALAEAIEKQGEGNKVIKVISDGYKKGERIIRAARVIIG